MNTVTAAPADAAITHEGEVLADPRWAAVQARDAAADGQFVFAVRSTGVYCRPSCPARTALPRHVHFFADGAAARAAGYRACLRCRPEGPGQAQLHAELVARACQHLAQAATPPKLDELAARLACSPHHLHRLFKAATGLTPRAYAAALRAGRLQQALPASASVTEGLYAAGYQGSAHFYAEAPGVLGMPAARYRAGGQGEQVRYATAACSLGRLLVAQTARGLCAISLGDDDAALVAELQQRFAQAERVENDAEFSRTLAEVVACVEAPRRAWQLPLDVQGTAFQRLVWQALREIAPGQTLTYTEMAQRLGRPNAVRAVASACAANTLAVAIPCHRVLRSGGALAGYRWGLQRKAALLAREKAGGVEEAGAKAPKRRR